MTKEGDLERIHKIKKNEKGRRMPEKIGIKKEKYNYYYNHDGEPIVTVCYLLMENGVVGRGIAVLSKQDKHDDIVGKKLAESYAIRAIKGRYLDNFKRKEVIDQLISCECPFAKKGERNPDLSWWERRFLFGVKKMHDYEPFLHTHIYATVKYGRCVNISDMLI